MKVLELFSGTGSFSKIARERGHETFTVELEESFKPDLCKDILEVTAQEIIEKFGKPDVIWASPPCTCFSVASISTHWTGGARAYIPKTENAIRAMQIVKKTIELIKELNPTFWIIENPRGVLRKLGILDRSPKTVTYCQYGDNRMKPTDLWTNINQWQPKPMCHNGDCCHEAAPRGSKTGTQGLKDAKNRSIVPANLCKEVLSSCENGKVEMFKYEKPLAT